MKRLSKNIYEVYLEGSNFSKKIYPDFVTSRRPDRIESIPVFTFHSIRPKTFEEQLGFLRENNYITVSADEFYNFLTGKSPLQEKAILLTMDDGRKSVWKYGFPLLKKFNFRATVFIIPGHTKEMGSEFGPPRFAERGRGVRSLEKEICHLNSEDIDDREILSWQEINIMRDSGLIDFGSHTLYHHRIFTGPVIIDFFGPGCDMRPYSYPAVPSGLEGAVLEEPSEFYGMPIYINDSLMSGKRRFIDDPEFREACVKYYKERFAPEMNPLTSILSPEGRGLRVRGKGLPSNWKKEMFRFSKEYRGRNSASKKFSTLEDMAEDIYENLSSSKKILEERLGKPVNHLCYPFGIWSELSTEVAKKAGYLSSFCAYIPRRQINKVGDGPYKIVRLKDDYIFRLPGKGRKSLSEIFILKMKRRLKGERVY